MLASCAAAVTLGLLLLLPSDDVQAKRHSVPLELELQPQTGNALTLPATPSSTPEAEPELAEADTGTSSEAAEAAEARVENNWQEVVVRPGDSLSLIFQRAGLRAADVHTVVHSSPEARRQLTRLQPGQTLAFLQDDEGTLISLRHQVNRLNATVYSRDGRGFSIEQVERQPETRQRFAYGTIESSLYMAGQAAGLPNGLVMSLANVFDGVIDFVYDIRKGDQFVVLFEERYLDGEKIGNGAILAARFTNRNTTHEAFRYVDQEGDVGYYSSTGVSMRKAFLRAPLDFTRVSSNFNMQRMHPIFNTVRPHRGVDYAAPTGTPVYAAGDGRVVESAFNRANGHYIVIQHGQQYTTKYLHLHRRNVKVGERVRQRQLIGTVGSTGYATGPHLHYEFLVDGVHRNPRTVLDKLPQAKRIEPSEMARFQQSISTVQASLAAYSETTLAAAATEPGDDSG